MIKNPLRCIMFIWKNLKRKVLSVMPKGNYYIGIDVGGTNARLGLVDENHQILFDQKVKSSIASQDFAGTIKTFVKKYQADYNIKAISIGFPGLVDQATRRVVNVPNEPRYEGDYLAQLEKELNIPIIIDNDVNYLMLYDAVHFNIPEDQSILGFYLGTGFGNAIRFGNQLYQGTYGAAGEIGHIPIFHDFDLKKGKQDHLEVVTSGYALIELHKKYFPNSPFETLFIDHFDSEPIQKYLHYLAFAIATEMIILDIPTIILGGGVMMSNQFPKAYLEDIIKRHLRSDLARTNFKAYYAEQHAQSGIIGAVIYAKAYLSKHKTT